jgi:nitrite reductase/ring-hydroxylating ferredoxin subunit
LFARLEDSSELTTDNEQAAEERAAKPSPRSDGFSFAANDADVSEQKGIAVSIAGSEYALFRVDGMVVAIDGTCPHAGGALADGTIDGCIVTCPLHDWTFNATTGCSVDPAGRHVGCYETKIEDGKVFINTTTPVDAAPTTTTDAQPTSTLTTR